jgi:fructose-bisphosphate aldolase / 6-deoxy-5-ketofructose 1-phosphate synthase
LRLGTCKASSIFISNMKINIPLSVPKNQEKEYAKNFEMATHGSGRMMMFAGDQKVEHLNEDFFGPNIPIEVADPEHYFKIASKADIGVFATQMGLMAAYGRDYKKINYLVKVNSKTNILEAKYKDPMSSAWTDIDEIIEFKKKSGLNIVGVGYTIYLGSWYEAKMFGEAARLINEAHKHGLLTVLWLYPRGRSVKNEKDTHLIAGGAGVALCLGADFAKVNHPYTKDSKKTAKEFKEVVDAAGRTGVICVGGSKKDEKLFLSSLHDQIHISGTRGSAIGRNIYQRELPEAIRMANAISAIVVRNKSVKEAYDIFKGKK